MNITDINVYFQNMDLDVRKTKVGTFIDQKVTPDVLCAVAECITEYLTLGNSEFSINDIRFSDFAHHIAVAVFGKPDIENASNEYDKFFSQPIKMLAYAGVLNERKASRSYIYTVNRYDLLEFIALRERNALNFIQEFCEKLLKDSNLFHFFEDFLNKQDKHSFEKMKYSFEKFMLENTPKNTEIEVRRIFTKIINPISYKYRKLGTKKGFLSKKPITLDELYYNRPNWRDKGKEKSLTRKEAIELLGTIEENANLSYLTNKAKKFVKQLHKTSEVHRWDPTEANQAHHIFMASEYPDLANVHENLICLTPNQHFNLAHPNNKTTVIDKNYQIICLISKLDSIEMDIRNNQNNYSYQEFINVLNTGFNTDKFNSSMSYEVLKHQIMYMSNN